jgi:predicted nucleic acid-binding protein
VEKPAAPGYGMIFTLGNTERGGANIAVAKVFLDTNVLVYAVDRADEGKHQRARELLDVAENVAISAQVLNEFFVVVTRKLAVPLDRAQAEAIVRELAQIPCVPIDVVLVQSAMEVGRRWQLSHWDALVVAAARQAGCERVLTEDLATGANYDGIIIDNPFV